MAEVCSGFHKIISLLAFASIYLYLFAFSPWKKVALFAATIPIAILANILRISGLIAVSSAGGMTAFHIAHEYADLVAVALALGIFFLLGRGIGCTTIRFSRLSGV